MFFPSPFRTVSFRSPLSLLIFYCLEPFLVKVAPSFTSPPRLAPLESFPPPFPSILRANDTLLSEPILLSKPHFPYPSPQTLAPPSIPPARFIDLLLPPSPFFFPGPFFVRHQERTPNTRFLSSCFHKTLRQSPFP